jgi:hypothetical protein
MKSSANTVEISGAGTFKLLPCLGKLFKSLYIDQSLDVGHQKRVITLGGAVSSAKAISNVAWQ